MTSEKNYNSCVSNRIQAILSGFLPSIHAVPFKGCLSSLIPPFLSPHSLSFIIYAWKCQIIGTLNDGRHFIVVVTVAWPILHSCMPILTTSLPLSFFLSVFLYQSNFLDRKHHHDNLPTPCETLWSHRLCTAHGSLFPMIHIYQMTWVSWVWIAHTSPIFPSLNTICHSKPHTHSLSVILVFWRSQKKIKKYFFFT